MQLHFPVLHVVSELDAPRCKYFQKMNVKQRIPWTPAKSGKLHVK